MHSWCRLCAASAWWRCCTHEMCAWVTLPLCPQHHFQCVGRLGVQTLPRNTEDSFVLAMEHFQFGNSSLLALCTTAGEIEGWDLRAPTQVAQIHTVTSMNCLFLRHGASKRPWGVVHSHHFAFHLTGSIPCLDAVKPLSLTDLAGFGLVLVHRKAFCSAGTLDSR